MFIKRGHCYVKQAGGTQNEVMWYPPCCFLSIFYYPQSSISPTLAFWLPRINKGKTKTCKFSTESWTLPMLIPTLKQVWGIETTVSPLSSLPSWLSQLGLNLPFSAHPQEATERPMMISDWSPSDHRKLSASLATQWIRMTFTIPWVVPTALSQLEYSLLMLLIFPSPNQRQNTGLRFHFPDLPGISLVSYLTASNENKTTALPILLFSIYSLDIKP